MQFKVCRSKPYDVSPPAVLSSHSRQKTLAALLSAGTKCRFFGSKAVTVWEQGLTDMILVFLCEGKALSGAAACAGTV